MDSSSANNASSSISKIKKRLEHLILSEESLIYNENKVLKYLNYLDTINMTIAILSHSEIGKLIRKMKKISGPIGDFATNLLKKWRLSVSTSSEISSFPKMISFSYQSANNEGGLKQHSNNFFKSSHNNYNKSTQSSNFSDCKLPSMISCQTNSLFQSNNNEIELQCLNKTGNLLNAPSSYSKNQLNQSKNAKIVSISTQPAPNIDTMNIRTRKYSNTCEQFRSQKGKTKVFAGKSTQSRIVLKLSTLCLRIIEINIDFLEEVGNIDYALLQPLFEKLPWDQVDRLERINHHFIGKTDYLWERFCKKLGYTGVEKTLDWKTLFFNSHQQQHQKLKFLTQSISARISSKRPATVAKKISIPSTHKLRPLKKAKFFRYQRDKSPIRNNNAILKIIRKQHLESKHMKNSIPHK